MEEKVINQIKDVLNKALKSEKIKFKVETKEQVIIYNFKKVNIEVDLNSFNESMNKAFLIIRVMLNNEIIYSILEHYIITSKSEDEILASSFIKLVKIFNKEENNMDASERIEEELEQSLLEDSTNEERQTPEDIGGKFIDLDGEIGDIDNKILEFRKAHSEIFDKLKELEDQKQKTIEEQDQLKKKLLDKMKEKKLTLLGYTFTKIDETIKRNFDSKSFYKDYSPKTKLYQKYVTETLVSSYIKVNRPK